jgi:hypothetical protein
VADFYSEHYSNTAASTSIDAPRIKVAPGLSHAKKYYKRGIVTTSTATAAGDVLRFFPMKSGDRIVDLLFSHTSDASTTVTADIGIHQTDGGSVVCLDLWVGFDQSPGSDMTATIGRLDMLTRNGSNLSYEDRAKHLWELADLGLGGGTYSENPFETWDVTATIKAETGIVATEYVMECSYTSAGA